MTNTMARDPDANEPRTVTVHGDAAGFAQEISVGRHCLAGDEPTSAGGTDTGPTPYEALLGALGGCTVMTLRMYADRKGWPLERATVRLRTARVHEQDCEVCETEEVGPNDLEREIELTGALTDEQRERLLAIADRCPVKQTLERGIKVVRSAG